MTTTMATTMATATTTTMNTTNVAPTSATQTAPWKWSMEAWHRDWCLEAQDPNRNGNRDKPPSSSSTISTTSTAPVKPPKDRLTMARLWIKHQHSSSATTLQQQQQQQQQQVGLEEFVTYLMQQQQPAPLAPPAPLAAVGGSVSELDTRHRSDRNSNPNRIVLRHLEWQVVLWLELHVRVASTPLFLACFAKVWASSHRPSRKKTKAKAKKHPKSKRTKSKSTKSKSTKSTSKSTIITTTTEKKPSTTRQSPTPPESSHEDHNTCFLTFLRHLLTRIAFVLPSTEPLGTFLCTHCLTKYMWKRLPHIVTQLLESFEVENPYLAVVMGGVGVTVTDKETAAAADDDDEDNHHRHQILRKRKRKALVPSVRRLPPRRSTHLVRTNHFHGMLGDVTKLLNTTMDSQSRTKSEAAAAAAVAGQDTNKTPNATTTTKTNPVSSTQPTYANTNTTTKRPIITPQTATVTAKQKGRPSKRSKQDQQQQKQQQQQQQPPGSQTTSKSTTTTAAVLHESPVKQPQQRRPDMAKRSNYDEPTTHHRPDNSSNTPALGDASMLSPVPTRPVLAETPRTPCCRIMLPSSSSRETHLPVAETPSRNYDVADRIVMAEETPHRHGSSSDVAETPFIENYNNDDDDNDDDRQEMGHRFFSPGVLTPNETKQEAGEEEEEVVKPLKLFAAISKRQGSLSQRTTTTPTSSVLPLLPRRPHMTSTTSIESSCGFLPTKRSKTQTTTPVPPPPPTSVAVAAARSFLRRKSS